MYERPRSRYTRAKTWAALHAQHLNAGYALIPFSVTSNSIEVIKCASVGEAQTTARNLLDQAALCEAFYTAKRTHDQAPELLRKARTAVVLAKSSDYYHYHLADEHPKTRLIICGQHNSYLHLPVWETSTNRQYRPRETAIPLTSPEFMARRKTEYGHAILLGALINGDEHALALVNDPAAIPPRTRRRILTEVSDLQRRHYRGRPLAFLDEQRRREIGDKISAGLIRYHAMRGA